MTNIEEQLRARGFEDDEITAIVELFAGEEAAEAAAMERAAELIRLVFLRVGRDSPAGCALRRALGFSGGISLSRAASDFCVKKQYLHTLQGELEAKLGTLRLGTASVADRQPEDAA